MHPVQSPETSLSAAILDALPAQSALLDAHGRILMVNAAWRQFAVANGMQDEHHAVGHDYLAACDDAVEPYAEHASEVAQGLRDILTGHLPSFMHDYPCHAPDEQRWFRVTAKALNGDDEARVVVMHTDITERHLAREHAGEMQRRLERLIDQAKVGILIHRNFRPILANQELARMLGYDHPQQILDLQDGRLLYPADEHARLEGFNAARLNSGTAPSMYLVKGQCRNGGHIIMENRAFTIEWGEQMAVCAMLTDITEQVKLQEQLRQSQRLEAVGQLTGGVAHDFNNLLTVILGNAELLAEQLGAAPRLRRLAQATALAAERGAELTSRLLSFSRRQPLNPCATDLCRHLSDMEPLLRRTLGEDVQVKVSCAPDLQLALVDVGQLDNAILNLCLNARDAMPTGGLLTLEASNDEVEGDAAEEADGIDAGTYIVLAVTDTGRGMDAETCKRAFEPFFTTKDVGQGSGLGLSMVYGFVRQSQGHVRIDSTPGHGTSVRLYLPLAAADDDAKAVPRATAPPARGRGRILLVEDDDMVREHVAAQLTDLGYEVVAAGNAAQALEQLVREARFDLLFTDVVMPGGMSGRDLADEVARRWPGLPVLFSSGYSEDAIVHQGRLDRGVHLLPKPYRKQELAAKLREVLAAS